MNEELKSINMSIAHERALLAKQTKNLETLYWFLPDVELDVIINIINNEIFNREALDRSNYLQSNSFEVKKELLEKKSKLLTNEELEKIKKFIQENELQDNIKNAICVLPWNHLGIMTNGDVRMCCQMIYKPYGLIGKNVKDIKNIDSIRNSDYAKNIRKQMLNGHKPKVCELCWTEERNKLKSKRQHQNSIYKDLLGKIKNYTKNDGEIDTNQIKLNYLDLRLGNKCNLSCRSCGPTESDKWYEESYNFGQGKIRFYNNKQYELIKKEGKIVINSEDFNWPDSTNFLSLILDSCNNIDRLYFTGGEPMLNYSHINFLENLVTRQMSSKIYLEYNSNGSTLPETILNLWPKFKGVGIGFSIDALETKFEYLRFPGKWNKVIKTLEKLDTYVKKGNKIDSGFAPTISIYNILHILDIYDYILFQAPSWMTKSIPIHVLEGPDYMSPKILPVYAKNQIKDVYKNWLDKINKITCFPNINKNQSKIAKDIANSQINNLINYINENVENSEKLLQDFYIKTEKMDIKRKQSYKKYFPELHELLKI